LEILIYFFIVFFLLKKEFLLKIQKALDTYNKK